jgi:hypothetical protein
VRKRKNGHLTLEFRPPFKKILLCQQRLLSPFPQADFNDRARTTVVSPPTLTHSDLLPSPSPLPRPPPRPCRRCAATGASALSCIFTHTCMYPGDVTLSMHACTHARRLACCLLSSPPSSCPNALLRLHATQGPAHLRTNPNSHRASLGPGGGSGGFPSRA